MEETFDGDCFTLEQKMDIVERIWTAPEIEEGAKEDVIDTFAYNQLTKPEDFAEVKNHWVLIQEVHDVVLPRILRLQRKFAKDAYISIGISTNPADRDIGYNRIPAFIKRSSFTPPLKLEHQIVYRSNHPFNCLCVEYILQKQMQSGMWSYKFGHRMNKQKVTQPRKKDITIEPCYVYVKFSTIPATLSKKDNKG